jgi:uncharacterized protein YbbK (DUF523 family)
LNTLSGNKRDFDRYIVSACLIGLKTRYDGRSCFNDSVKKLVLDGVAIPVCPEQLAGLPTPRSPAEIVGGTGYDVLLKKARVINREGTDLTEKFIDGARQTLNLAQIFRASKAVLKTKSPSCGCGLIYDGTFSGNLVEGDGVTAALLKQEGIEVFTEEEIK